MNVLKFKFHPEAIIEATEAFEWYAAQSPNVAERFMERLNEAQTKVLHDPDCWPKYLLETRVFNFQKFPYGLVYVRRSELVIGLAVAHFKMRPGYWHDRLTH